MKKAGTGPASLTQWESSNMTPSPTSVKPQETGRDHFLPHCPQVESNHHLSFRRALLYPLEL